MRVLIISTLFAALATGTQAQVGDSRGFDPADTCAEILSGAPDIDKMMVAAWAFGYLAATQDTARPVDLDNNSKILGNIIKACQSDTSLTLMEIAAGGKKQSDDIPGNDADARRVLEQFLDPAEDRVALTAALKPTEADIRAVYDATLADKLVPYITNLYSPGVSIGPKPDQDAVFMVHATTGQLKSGAAVLREFPGGYKQVAPFMLGDFPIVRFKFVRAGETTGLAFDGLIHVHGRWVLIPKPWRVME